MINKFPERMKELRERYNLSQTDIAYLLNETPVQVGNWERGDRKPNLDTIIKLSNLFNTTSDYLIGATNIFSPHNKLIEDAHIYNRLLKDIRERLGGENYQRYFENREVFKNEVEIFISHLDEIKQKITDCLFLLNQIQYQEFDPMEDCTKGFGAVIDDNRISQLSLSYQKNLNETKLILDDYKSIYYTLGLLEEVVACENIQIEKVQLEKVYSKIDFDKFNTSFIHHLYLLNLQGK